LSFFTWGIAAIPGLSKESYRQMGKILHSVQDDKLVFMLMQFRRPS